MEITRYVWSRNTSFEEYFLQRLELTWLPVKGVWAMSIEIVHCWKTLRTFWTISHDDKAWYKFLLLTNWPWDSREPDRIKGKTHFVEPKHMCGMIHVRIPGLMLHSRNKCTLCCIHETTAGHWYISLLKRLQGFTWSVLFVSTICDVPAWTPCMIELHSNLLPLENVMYQVCTYHRYNCFRILASDLWLHHHSSGRIIVQVRLRRVWPCLSQGVPLYWDERIRTCAKLMKMGIYYVPTLKTYGTCSEW